MNTVECGQDILIPVFHSIQDVLLIEEPEYDAHRPQWRDGDGQRDNMRNLLPWKPKDKNILKEG